MIKYRIYIDEVGNNDLSSSHDPNHRFLCLTGVIVDLNYVKEVLSKEMEALKTKYFQSHPDDPIIFHRKELINKKFPFQNLKDPNIEKNFNDDLLFHLDKWQYKIITVLIDKYEHNLKYHTWRYDPYHYCMAILFERFHLRLKEINQYGDMMFESRGGKEDIRLKESYRKIFEQGTDYINPNFINETLTSKEIKIKGKSQNISGLQLADLLAYPARTFAFDFYNIDRKETPTFNEKIIPIIKNKLYNNNGRFEGYGLKLLP